MRCCVPKIDENVTEYEATLHHHKAKGIVNEQQHHAILAGARSVVNGFQ